MNRMIFFLTQQTYDLIVIDEGEAPLAAAPVGSGYYAYAVTAVFFAALIALASVWITRRNALKKRLLEIRERSGNSDTSVPVTIKAIRDAINEAEAESVAIAH